MRSVFLLILIIFPLSAALSQTSLKSADLSLEFGKDGSFTKAVTFTDQRNHLLPSVPSFLLRVRTAGGWENPAGLTADVKQGILRLKYPKSGVVISLKTRECPAYISMEIVSVKPEGIVDAVSWGPLALDLPGIGEIVGLSANDTITVGMMGLNVKTLGGEILNEEGSDPSRSNSAKKIAGGSALQAYSLDRSKPRKVTCWWGQFPGMPVEPMKNETVKGSKVAFFASSPAQILERIEEIELREGLPHPVIDGCWSKRSPRSGRSYLIADFSEETIGELLDYTARANLQTLYHMNAWKSWGHYDLNPEFFPNGMKGLKTCMEKASQKGILLGAHTLSNFINTNDPYVTPVPDRRLAVTGRSVLVKPSGAKDSTLQVASPEYFTNTKADWLHTVRIDDELISYRTCTAEKPYRLLGCKRGAFGTNAEPHPQSAEVNKLMDHPYMVFFPNLELQQEIAVNLAKRFNETGFRQMDFDGFEGCLSAGQGDYGQELFAKTFYENLDHWVLNGTSMSKPFYWHINTYCNWGEPWNGGFTEAMQQYRIDNQGLFDRNLMPHMLGWYLLTDSTTLEEMEWMLARAAGYNAGFGMATSLKALRANPRTALLLDAIREWEMCRRDGAFPKELLPALRDPSKEFHLEKIRSCVYDLYTLTRTTGADGKPVYNRGMPVRIVIPVE